MPSPSLTLPLIALAAVEIELPAGTTDAAESRVIESCCAALGEGQCVPAGTAKVAEWHASVSWQDIQLVVTLERVSARGELTARRELWFSTRDSEEQLWVAAGLMVAALTAAQTQTEVRPEPEMPPAPAEQPKIRSRIGEWLPFFDIGGLAGPGLEQFVPRYGLLARGSVLFRPWAIGPTASLRTASSFADPEVRWYGGSGGIVLRPTSRSSRAEADIFAEFVLERTRASSVNAGVEEVATSSWRAGGRVGFVGSLRLASWFGPWLAADVTLLRPKLEVRVVDRTVGSEEYPIWAFSVGGRFYLYDSSP